MADAIGSLFISLGMDSAQFDAGILKARKSIAEFGNLNLGKGLSTGLNELGKGFRSSASQAGILGSALSAIGPAGVLAGAALVGLGAAANEARKALAFGDEIGDTAAKLGVTTDALQEYRYAVHQLGGEYTDADAALAGFSKAFGAAHAQLTKKATRPFEALGLDAKSFSDTEDALAAVIDKISALKSTAEQAAIADKLGLTPMLSALRAGSAEIDRLRQAAHSLGFVMDADLVAKAGEANDKFEDLSHILDVQVKSAFVDLAPVILDIATAIDDAAKRISGFIDKIKPALDAYRQFNDFQKKYQGADPVTYAKAYVKTVNDISAGAQVGEYYRQNPAPELSTDPLDNNFFSVGNPLLKNDGTSLAPPAPKGGAASHVADASAQAIEAARRAELAAQMQITKGAVRLADLQLAQIDGETKASNDRLLRDAAEGKITKAAAQQAITSNNNAAADQRIAVKRQLEDALAGEALSQRQAVAGFVDQTLRAEAEMAATATERGQIEAAALENRQALEREELAVENAQKVRDGQRTQAQADALVADQQEAQAAEQAAQAQQQRRDVLRERADKQQAALDLEIEMLQNAGNLAQSDYARAVIALRILKLQQQIERVEAQTLVDTTQEGSTAHANALARLAILDQLQAMQTQAAEENANLQNAILGAANDFAGLFVGIKHGDLASAFGALSSSMRSFAGILGQTGKSVLGKLGTTFGSIGATAQIGQSLGLGTGKSGADLGLSALGYIGGTAFSSTLGALAGTGVAELGMTLGGSVAGSIVAGSSVATLVGAAAGPIGMLAALALGSLLGGGKESNHGAIASINGGNVQLSGDKRTDQTAQLATATAQTIIQSQQALEAAGVKFAATVSSIDIGTRDATHILLSTGQKLEAGVGDAAGAAEAALEAMLQGATYANDAQKQLVQSMLAAGAGFDKVADALNLFNRQAALPKAINDAILQLADPKAYDIEQLQAAQATRRGQVNDAVASGALTAEQAASLGSQLTKLESLEMDQVLARYGDAVDAAGDSAQAMADAVSAAEATLKSAWQAEAQELQASAKRFADIGTGLRGFLSGLSTSSLSSFGAGAQTSITRATLAQLAAQIPKGDADTLSQLQNAAQAFLTARKATAPTLEAFGQDMAWVRKLLGEAATVADQQASLATQQLDALHDQVAKLIDINDSVVSVQTAIANLQAAITAAKTAPGAAISSLGGGAGGANDNAPATASYRNANGDPADFVSPEDIAKVEGLFTIFQDKTGPLYGQRDVAAADLLRGFRAGQGDPLSGTYNILKNAGFEEVEAGLNRFANGGSFGVGGSGGVDSQLVQFMATPGIEHVSITHGDPLQVMTARFDKMVDTLQPGIEAGAIASRKSAKLLDRWEAAGMPPTRVA